MKGQEDENCQLTGKEECIFRELEKGREDGGAAAERIFFGRSGASVMLSEVTI